MGAGAAVAVLVLTLGQEATPSTVEPTATADRGTRYVYIAAVGGLLAGGVLAYVRRKRASGETPKP